MIKREDYMTMQAMAAQGMYQKDIAQALNVHPKTVSRALTRGGSPKGERTGRGSKLDPYRSQVDELLREGVWNASVILREIQARGYSGGRAVRAAKATGLPVWVSFMLGPDNHLLSGETLKEALHGVMAYQPQAVLVNCLPVAQVPSALTELQQDLPPDVWVGAYANAGHMEEEGWSMEHGVTPIAYAQAASGWRRMGARILGGCCGTIPEHIAALTERLAIGD
jgi:methionine synthase I (cobalamin-dependent)